MFHWCRRIMFWHFMIIEISIISITKVDSKSLDIAEKLQQHENRDYSENDIIDFDSVYNDKYNRTFKDFSSGFDQKSNLYTIIDDVYDKSNVHSKFGERKDVKDELTTTDNYSLEIKENFESTTDNLGVIPLSTTIKFLGESTTESNKNIANGSTTEIKNSVSTDIPLNDNVNDTVVKAKINITKDQIKDKISNQTNNKENIKNKNNTDVVVTIEDRLLKLINSTTESSVTEYDTTFSTYTTSSEKIDENEENTTTTTILTTKESDQNQDSSNDPINAFNSTEDNKNRFKKEQNDTDTKLINESGEVDVPIFTELDVEEEEVPEDYYDSKDVLPTKPPSVDAFSVILGLAGSVVESMAEKVVPKGIFDLFKRMQKQNEALEAEKLRSREENGGIGQFGRGILKQLSSGLSRPLSQLMSGATDKGSLDSDSGFVSSISSVATVANSYLDAFKNRVQAIYPGTVWCGDGHSSQARSSDLGLFFFTDTCCRQHDACKLYIKAGDTKYGLTNTGLFTRSHCSCDAKFRECLQRTNSLVSTQIGLTYFNVLGPQCFRKAHPIVKCVRKTRITGQKCEEYELDYTKPKMWQWFDNETY